ncbi:MAG: Spy/CpxP family protein refolding chaperone [Candidatus Electrothrix sp. Rat3]|nr:Spy/CpxP family protein refolding chaperone [Candidatus Electrothrix rattekaaiensis]
MKRSLNKKIVTAVLAGLLTVSLLPMTANACRRGGQGGGQGSGCAMKGGQNGKQFGGALGVWKNAQAIKDLGLSAEQVGKLKEADFAAREKQQALRAELGSLRLKMEHAFAADKVDEDAARILSKEMATVKGKMIEQRTETRLTLRSLLTPEQHDKLRTLRQNRRSGGQGNGMNKPCMMNGQGGGGQGMKKGMGRM